MAVVMYRSQQRSRQGQRINTSRIDEDLPLGPIAESKFYGGDQPLPVYMRGLTKGMNTDDAAGILLKPFADRTLMTTRVPTNIAKNLLSL